MNRDAAEVTGAMSMLIILIWIIGFVWSFLPPIGTSENAWWFLPALVTSAIILIGGIPFGINLGSYLWWKWELKK